MTPEQTQALLAHIQVLTSRLFALSNVAAKIELMQSLQDMMVAFEVDE